MEQQLISSPEELVERITRETHSLVRRIRVAFDDTAEEVIEDKIIVSMLTPGGECAAMVHSPSTKQCTKKLERIQRAATKFGTSFEKLYI